MAINESAFPYVKKTEFTDKDFIEHIKGLSKLEYTAIKIFCSMLSSTKNFGSDKQMLKSSVEQAKLLLQKCEDESK